MSCASPIRIIDDPRPRDIPERAHAFLDWLGEPTLLRITGHDSSRCRGIVTLLHGNEPSGTIALLEWLLSGARPAVDLLLFFGAVDAAREPPGFAHRMLPGRRDLNRCFRPPLDDREGRIAAALREHLVAARCEAVVDLHNNTGHNPAYGVLVELDRRRVGLVSLFASRCVLNELGLATLVDALGGSIPAVAIECGQSGDPRADQLARRGIERFVNEVELPLAAPRMVVYEDSIRVCFRDEISVAFASEPAAGVDLTIDAGVESHNFQQVDAGTRIGWVHADAPWPLTAVGRDGIDASRDYFTVRNGTLTVRQHVVPIMMTTDARAAMSDCLCYLVRPRPYAELLAGAKTTPGG